MRAFLLRALLVLILPAGCGGCPATTCKVALTAGGDGMAHVAPALEATAAQFLGSGSADPGGGMAEGGPGGLPRLPLGRDTLSADSDTAHRRLSDRRLGLRVEAGAPLSRHLAAFAAMSIAAGQSRHLLPQGLGPLADPMRIGFDRISVTPEMGVRWTRPLPDVAGGKTDLTLTLSAGQEISRVRTTVRSALLDVRNDSMVRQGFVSLGAGLGLSAAAGGPRIEAIAEARLMEGGARLVQGGLRLSR
jgi:hypothetical protein